MRNPAVFLDRDGVINKFVKSLDTPYVADPDHVVILPDVYEAIRKLNATNFLVIVVTNQPAVSWGQITHDDVKHTNHFIDDLLKMKCAYVTDWFYCPHHPEIGHLGERKELKIECNCRKPKPGMLYVAAQKWNIELSQSYMIGDSPTDKQAGEAAGCKQSFQIKTNSSLLVPVNIILEGEKRT